MRSPALAALLLATALLAAAPHPAGAQALLYDPMPPPGSAYLRVVNATAAPLEVEAGGVTLRLGATPKDRVGTYRVVQNVAQRKVAVHAATGAAEFDLAAGSFNTVLLLAGQPPRALRDETEFNQVRARLTFYNATPTCAQGGLRLDPQGPAVFEAVPQAASRMRAVNPVTASVTATCDGKPAPSFALGGLEASGRYSIWLMRLPEPVAFMTRDATEVWKP